MKGLRLSYSYPIRTLNISIIYSGQIQPKFGILQKNVDKATLFGREMFLIKLFEIRAKWPTLRL